MEDILWIDLDLSTHLLKQREIKVLNWDIEEPFKKDQMYENWEVTTLDEILERHFPISRFNKELTSYLTCESVVHHLSCIDTSQWNWVADRKNRHLLKVNHALLFQMKVQSGYWGNTILTATLLINWMPIKVLWT